jgi:hypothetical protein
MPEEEKEEELTDYPNFFGETYGSKHLKAKDEPPSEGWYNETLPFHEKGGRWMCTCGKCLHMFPPEMLDENSMCPKCRIPEIRLESEALEYEWKDIDDEEFRTYEFPGGCKVVIDHPLKIHVSKSGGHRIFDQDGISHYIPSGWINLWWIAKENEANFRF